MKKLPYKEGTWFAVPLEKGGFAVGRVARHSPGGCIVLAYFFGPKVESVPKLEDVACLRPEQSVWIRLVGDLGLIDGTWPIIGDSANWDRREWPVPVFTRRVDILVKAAWRVQYSDDDPNVVVAEERIPYDPSLPNTDGSSGHLAAQVHLSRIMAS